MRRTIPIEIRLQNKYFVNKETGCWIWLAGRDGHGYARISLNGKMVLAHRIIYELNKGKIPDNMELHHKCNYLNCVNPEHMEPLTRQEHNKLGTNVSVINKAKTHCENGHEYNTENTGWRMSKGINCRYCKECNRMRSRSVYFARGL